MLKHYESKKLDVYTLLFNHYLYKQLTNRFNVSQWNYYWLGWFSRSIRGNKYVNRYNNIRFGLSYQLEKEELQVTCNMCSYSSIIPYMVHFQFCMYLFSLHQSRYKSSVEILLTGPDQEYWDFVQQVDIV